MKKKLLFGFLAIMLVVGTILAGCAAPAPEEAAPAPAPAAPEVIKWTMQTYQPDTPPFGPYKGHMFHAMWMWGWAEWLEDATDGRLQIEIVPPGAIYPSAEILTAVGTGVVDGGMAPTIWLGGTVPEENIHSGLPGAWESVSQMYEAWYDYGLHDLIVPLYDQRNVVYFGVPSVHHMFLWSTFPMPDPESVQGKKFRGFGPWSKFLDLIGVTPVSLPFAEMYMAVKLGTVDGVFTAATAIETGALYEVVSDYVFKNTTGANGLLINKDSFNALPEDIQSMINDFTPFFTTIAMLRLFEQEEYVMGQWVNEGTLTIWHWPEEYWMEIRERCLDELWPEFAAASPLCAEMVEIVRQQLIDHGRLPK